jgi:hypothetical protein
MDVVGVAYFVVFALTNGAFTSCPALLNAAEAAADFASNAAWIGWGFELSLEGGFGIRRGVGLVVDGPGWGVVPRDEGAEELHEWDVVVRCIGQNMW